MSRPALLRDVTAILVGCVLGLTSSGCRRADEQVSAASSATPSDPPRLADVPSLCAARRPAAFTLAGVRGASSSSLELIRAKDRTLALVADADERALHVIDTADMKEIGVTPLEGRPEHVLALEDGRVLVTLRDPGGLVSLEPAAAGLAAPLEVRCDVDAGSDPGAIARDAGRVYVTSGFDAGLIVLAASTLDPVAVVHLPREPRGIVVDGPRGWVAHAVGGTLSVVDLESLSSPVVHVSLATVEPPSESDDPKKPAPAAPRRRTGQGHALVATTGHRADGSRGTLRFLAPHTVSDTGPTAPTRGYGGGGLARTVAPFVAVVDPIATRMISTDAVAPVSVVAPDVCQLPRGVALLGDALYVACLDADVVLELDARLADPMSLARKTFSSPQPAAVALDGKESLLVHSALSRTLTRHPLAGGTPTEIGLWRRTDAKRDAVWLRGRALFHTSRDARIGGGHACAGCHPDGRDDGLVWSSPNGPRQTPALAGRIEGSAPYGWFGESATLRGHLDHTFARLGGTGFAGGETSAADVAALARYVASLTQPQRDPGGGRSGDAVARGRDVYVAYGCQGCHPDGKADGKAHDVGSGRDGDRRAAFDTPWLVGVGASAPYFHDGRYETLEDVLSAKDSRMFSGTIGAADRDALVAYLRTL